MSAYLKAPISTLTLLGMLFNCRFKEILVCCDIEKAFLMVGIHPSDRDCLRFLWLKDVSQAPSRINLEVYRFCRVPFGVICSPFLLQATIDHLLHSNDSALASEISASKYMDNIFYGAQNVDSALCKYKEIKQLFHPAGMNIREFQSNSSEFLNFLPEIDRDPATSPKFLGIKWARESDTFIFRIPNFSHSDCITKSDVLSFIASIFDPLGFLEPIKVIGKLFFQKIWMRKAESESPTDEQAKNSAKIKRQKLWSAPLTSEEIC